MSGPGNGMKEAEQGMTETIVDMKENGHPRKSDGKGVGTDSAKPSTVHSWSDRLSQRLSSRSRQVIEPTSLADDHLRMSLGWVHLNYDVRLRTRGKGLSRKAEWKTVLTDCNGLVLPGEMVAIMGSSGAGKTTLLNILAGRVEQGRLSGKVLVNGKKRGKLFKTQSAYVEQDDLMFALLTVRETLRFAARLRLPKDMTIEEKHARVESVILELGLGQCASTYIGGPEVRGISGGERKRTAIAVELLKNPSLLFLDEPTSGLDAFTAYNIVDSLGRLAKRDRTVLMTIHQPRANIFALFDKIILLSQGKVLYFGPTRASVDYFKSIGFDCPTYTNPSDYFMDIITVDLRSDKLREESQTRVDYIRENYVEHEDDISQGSMKRIEEIERNQAIIPEPIFRTYNASRWDEWKVLSKRSFRNYIRDRRTTLFTWMQSLILALLIGGIYFNVSNDQTGIQNRLGALFFIILNQTFSSLFPILGTFPQEIAVFKRERYARTYRTTSYYMAKSFSEFPIQLIGPVVFAVITYWMIGFQATALKFFLYLFMVLAVVFCAQSLGLAISAAVPNVTIANIVAPLIVIIFTLFGGFYLNTRTVWGGFIWIKYISFVNYAFRGIAQNEFNGLTFSCSDARGGACFMTGEQVLDFYNLQKPPVAVCIVVVIGFGIIFRIIGFFCLMFTTRPRKALL